MPLFLEAASVFWNVPADSEILKDKLSSKSSKPKLHSSDLSVATEFEPSLS